MFQERILKNYEHLTPGHRKLADFLIEHTFDAAFLTATEVARYIEVDPATVVRFAQELGYTGYRELAQEIKRYVHAQITQKNAPSTETNQPIQKLKARLEHLQHHLQYLTAADFERLGEIVTLLNIAPHIWIVAEDTGWDLARAFARNLQNINISAEAFYPNLLETALRLHEMQAGDALLALGNAGPEIDIGAALRLAREKGVRTICLSSHGTQSAMREAELALVVPCHEPALFPGFTFISLLLALLWETLTDLRQQQIQHHTEACRANIAKLLTLRSEDYQCQHLAIDIWASLLQRARHPPPILK